MRNIKYIELGLAIALSLGFTGCIRPVEMKIAAMYIPSGKNIDINTLQNVKYIKTQPSGSINEPCHWIIVHGFCTEGSLDSLKVNNTLLSMQNKYHGSIITNAEIYVNQENHFFYGDIGLIITGDVYQINGY